MKITNPETNDTVRVFPRSLRDVERMNPEWRGRVFDESHHRFRSFMRWLNWRYVALSLLIFFMMACGSALLLVFLNSKHIYADTQPAFKWMEDAAKFVHGHSSTIACDPRSTKLPQVDADGNTQCFDVNGDPDFFVYQH